MSNYRRNYHPGATFFFTVVTHERRPILTTEHGRSCMRKSLLDVKARRPFDLVAIVLLPDHLHAVWTLPHGDSDFTLRWSQIKEGFTRRFMDANYDEGRMSLSRERHRERAVWQRRF
jgi:putative transposase